MTSKTDLLPLTPSEVTYLLESPEALQALCDAHDYWESCADGMDMPDSAKYHRERRERYRVLLGQALDERAEQ